MSFTCSFVHRGTPATGLATVIALPGPVRPGYATPTDADGRVVLAGVPAGYGCRAEFRTAGFGEGEVVFPPGPPAEVRLIPAGGLRVVADGVPGADLRGMWVSAHAAPRDPDDAPAVDGSRSARHPAGGELVLRNLIPGRYHVVVEGGPRHPVLPVAAATADVPPGGTAEVRVPIRSAGRVVGRVVDAATGRGVGGAKVRLAARGGADAPGYGGVVTTDPAGGFAAYVPAGVGVVAVPDDAPPGYALPEGWRGGWQARPVTAASGETVTLPDVRLPARRELVGRAVADGIGVPGATVHVAWDLAEHHPPATITTAADGTFRVPAPAGRWAAVRVRAGDRVNEVVVHPPAAADAPLAVPVSAAAAVRLRGRAVDAGGQPVGRAKVVVEWVPAPATDLAGGPAPPPAFAPAEVEAVFTDPAGWFETGPLWPGCGYTLTVTADGRVPATIPVRPQAAGRVVEVGAARLTGAGSVARGVVVGPDGTPLAGATVVNSGDGPARVEVVTDEAGRFALPGLYEGHVVVVAGKPGYHRGYAAGDTRGAGLRVVLRAAADPPILLPPPADEGTRRAATALLARLDAAAARDAPPPPGPADRWAAARADLDAFLARPPAWGRSPRALVELAGAVAADRSKALRVLGAAADAARRPVVAPRPEGWADLPYDPAALSRATDLGLVGGAAADLGFRAEAAGWLTEAEGVVRGLPADVRGGLLAPLVGAWAVVDPARADRLFAEFRGSDDRAAAAAAAVERLAGIDPARAAGWVDRFPPVGAMVDFHRSRVAVLVADRNLPAAARVAGGIGTPLTRAVTLARLAASPAADPATAHRLIDQAASALEAAPLAGGAGEMVPPPAAAAYVAWRAAGVRHPVAGGVVALALASRPPVRADARAGGARREAAADLAASLGGLDPAAGRALLGPDFAAGVAADPDYRSGYGETWLTALGLCDPAAAVGLFDPDEDADAASGVWAALRRPAAVIGRLEADLRLGWGGPTEAGDGN